MATIAESTGNGFIDRVLAGEITRVILIGLVVGILGGMGTFVYSRPGVSPYGDSILGLVFLALAGGYTHVLARTMWESVRAMVVGFLVGMGTTILAWVLPLWLVPLHPSLRDLLIMSYLQQAVATVLMAYLLVYFAGYFLVVSIDGIFG